MNVHTFKKSEIKKELKNTPELIQKYIKALENINEINKHTLSKAVAKIKELNKGGLTK